jgi:DNA primase catalytic core
MSNQNKQITDWIKSDLYPQLYSSIGSIFPELNFTEKATKWASPLKLDLTIAKDKAKDKTYISLKAPGWICENGGDTLSLIDYLMNRDSLAFSEALRKLSEIAGLELPPLEDEEGYKEYTKRASILEDCNSYFIYCLENAKGAEEVKAYLSSRGYSNEDVKAMELGYIPSQEALTTYLTETRKHDKNTVEEVVKLNRGIGSTHRLIIPYRSGGAIKGFIVRATGEATPKYLLSTNLERGKGFFNISPLKGDKDLIIVEGYLDALICDVKGVENVVALGGAKISPDQVKDAITKGAKSFTLCLDNDQAGKEGILQAIEIIQGEGVNKVYIVTLPSIENQKTDPDSYIKEKGVEAFREALREALPYYEYKLQQTLKKYGKIEEERGLQPKDRDSLLEEVVETVSKIPDAIDRDRYKKLFTSLDAIKDYGISEESLTITVDRITTTRDKEAQEKDFKSLLSQATKLQEKGETDKALELLDTKVKEVKLKDKATEFSRLLIPTSEAKIKEEEANLPESLNSGFKIDGEELLLPGGAISVYVAPTNHGKTILLINTAINVAQRYPDKKFVFFTYEERDTSILQYFLNTYIDTNLNSSDKANRRILREYFKTGSTQFISSSNLNYFESKKAEFFRDYIETGRILVKYVDYNSQELTTAIEYINKESRDIGGVFIDYFQLLKLPKEKNSRQEELKQICMSLKDTAVRTGLPLILAGQFNREVTNLMRLHPTNIGEAGDIERIVNTLVGLWNMDKKPVLKGIADAERDEINERIKKRRLQGEGAKNMYLEILKSRDLPTGSYDFLEFNGNTGKVKNREESSSSSALK